MRSALLIALSLTLLLPGPASLAQPPAAGTPAKETRISPPTDDDLAARVNSLAESKKNQRQQIKWLNARLEKLKDSTEREPIEQELLQRNESLSRSRKSMEQLLVGGVEIAALTNEPAPAVSWQDELQQVMMPLLASLRELTAKPRRIESLRTGIDADEERLRAVTKARAGLARFDKLELSPDARTALDSLNRQWRARESEIQQSLDVARTQLASLDDEDTSWAADLTSVVNDFLRDRGITLLLALGIGCFVWLILRGLYWLYAWLAYRKQGPKSRSHIRLARFIRLGMTTMLSVIAMLCVFYMRSDVLLFTLSIVIIAFSLLSLRQWLPHYVREARILLNVGPVREGERVLIDGVPFEAKSINVYSLFMNPDLRGMRRLPIGALHGMTSRPSLGDEAWFPSRVGDCVMLADGTFGQVLSQTIDFVQLSVMGSPLMLPTSTFAQQGVRNISREGFGIGVTFGIDYQHQAIALEQVPAAFEDAARAAFRAAGLGRLLKELKVEFSAASASSLDFRIFATFDGKAADKYFAVGRLIQRACVETCNQRGWGIPFQQITVHQA